MLVCSNGTTSQEIHTPKNDHFGVTCGLTFGQVNYWKDHFVPIGTYHHSTNQPVPGVPFYHTFVHEIIRSKARVFILQLGTHLPLFQQKKWSFGFDLGAGIGIQNHFYPDEPIYNDPHEIISSNILDLQAKVFVRYYYNEDFHFSIKGGMRFIRAYDNFRSPILSIHAGYKWMELGVYSHLMANKYYRIYSNGDIEVAKKIYEFGVSLVAQLDFKRSNKDSK
jgi:hypothetical protein